MKIWFLKFFGKSAKYDFPHFNTLWIYYREKVIKYGSETSPDTFQTNFAFNTLGRIIKIIKKQNKKA